VIVIGVYGNVKVLYFWGITPSLNLIGPTLNSDAFVSGNRISLGLYFCLMYALMLKCPYLFEALFYC
jgi:hypothetical protein